MRKILQLREPKSLFSLPINDGNRGPAEVKRVPQTVLEIASVGKMGGFRIIAKEDESRGLN